MSNDIVLVEDNEPYKLTWVKMSEKLYEDIQAKTSIEAKESLIVEQVNKCSKGFQDDLDYMEEDLLVTQAKFIEYRKKFVEVKQQHENALYAIWERTDENLAQKSKEIREYIDRVVFPLKNEVEKLDNMLKQLSEKIDNRKVAALERMVETMERFNKLGEDQQDFIKEFLK